MQQRPRSLSLRERRSVSKPAGQYGLFAHLQGRSAWGFFARHKLQSIQSKRSFDSAVETHVYSIDNGRVSVSLAVPANDHYYDEIPGEPECTQKLFRSTLELRISPAEEALAKYILDNADSFAPAGTRTMELGAGHFGFTGLAIAVATEATCVHLTDGSSSAVADLERQISLNKHQCGSCKLVSMVLQWEEHPLHNQQDIFDLIVGADIVYRDGSHRALINTISRLLAEDGVAVLCGSFRNHQLEAFVELAKSQFRVTVKPLEDDEDLLQDVARVRGVERAPVTLVIVRRIPPPSKKPSRPSPLKKKFKRIPRCARISNAAESEEAETESDTETETKVQTKRCATRLSSAPAWKEQVAESPPPTPRGCPGTRWWVTKTTESAYTPLSLRLVEQPKSAEVAQSARDMYPCTGRNGNGRRILEGLSEMRLRALITQS